MAEKSEDLSRARELVSDYLTVLDAHMLRAGSKWITAVLTAETPNGSRSLRFYRWKNVDGEWKKASGFNVNSASDWREIKENADEMIRGLWEEGET